MMFLLPQKADNRSGYRDSTSLPYAVAVVIPIYNVESYLTACIDSVVDQTIFNQIQLILINDGSTDNSGEIAQAYADRHENIIYRQKQNEGQGVARNLGMSLADAEYVIFLDSDDRMPPDACELLLDEVEKSNADLVIGRPMWKYPDGSEKPFGYLDHWYTEENYQRNMREVEEIALNHPIPVAKIYSLRFLRANNLQFPPMTGEDVAFAFCVFDKAEHIQLVDHIAYWRTERDDPTNPSVMQTFTLKTATDRIELLKLLLEHADRSTLSPAVFKEVYSRIDFAFGLIEKIGDEEDQREARRRLGECLYTWSAFGERKMFIDPLLRSKGYPGGLYGLLGDPTPSADAQGSAADAPVSVVIEPGGDLAALDQTLNLIKQQTHPACEVLLSAAPSDGNGLQVTEISSTGVRSTAAWLNKAVRQAKGRYVRIVRAGDQLPTDHLARQVDLLERSQDKVKCAYAVARKLPKKQVLPHGDLTREVLLTSECGLSCEATLMVERETWETLGGLDDRYTALYAADFLLRLFAGGCLAEGVYAPDLSLAEAGGCQVDIHQLEGDVNLLLADAKNAIGSFGPRVQRSIHLQYLKRVTAAAFAGGDCHFLTRTVDTCRAHHPELLVPFIGWLQHEFPEAYAHLPSAYVVAAEPEEVVEEAVVQSPAEKKMEHLLRSSSRWTFVRDYLRALPAFLKCWKEKRANPSTDQNR